MNESLPLSVILNELGENREHYYNAVSPAIAQSSNFCFPSVYSMRDALQKEFENPFYTRGFNPTVGILRQKLAALEGAEDALVCGSGSAAVSVAVIGNLNSGDHVICVQKPYSWTYKLLDVLLARFGVETTFIDGTSMSNFEVAKRPNTRMVFIESPNSMTFELQDIRAVATFAKENGYISIIDNSYSSPLFQQPHLMGIDLVVHSATKYLNGHSDVVAGAICGSREMIQRLFASDWMTLGPAISPHDAWLLMRGLRTLEIRANRSADTAEFIIPILEKHPKLSRVIWPFSEQHPQHELARKQMKRSAGMFSLVINTDSSAGVERFCDSLKHFLIACSWGGYESLVFPVCGLASTPSYDNPLMPWNLVRVYVGLEDPQLLLADILQALDQV
jgi:cystathionine beta-lyase/cystathionine gamma-synthase